ncbi:MAG: hypothetical protein V1771_01680 [Chloroflexota bacterium]
MMNKVREVDEAQEETTIRLKWFAAATKKPEEFVDELEALCKKFCGKEGFFFDYRFEG